jgi:membrane-associated phospholipid phosphatase
MSLAEPSPPPPTAFTSEPASVPLHTKGERLSSRSVALRLLTSIVLFAFVAIGGVYFASNPGPTSVDRLANRILPPEYGHHWLTYITYLGRARVLIPGVVLCCVLAFFWDRRRVVTCLVAPAVAVAITEYLAKPAVGRMAGGSLTYPSGHMTSVAALLTVFVLAVPPRWRRGALVFGVAIGLLVGVTLILLRWHYLTDVLAGAAVAIATALLVDSILHMHTRRSTAAELLPADTGNRVQRISAGPAENL